MNTRKITVALLAIVAWLAFASQALGAAPVPVWRLTATSQPTNFISSEPPSDFYPLYDIVATNVGGAPTSGPITITDTLPEGISPVASSPVHAQHNNEDFFPCTVAAQVITCEDPEPLGPGQVDLVEVHVEVSAPNGATLTNQAKVSGGGALDAGAETETTIATALPDFGFLSGLNGTSALFNGADGSPATQAGSHPYQLTVDLGFPSRRLGAAGSGDLITGVGGGLRDLITDLPRGMIVNPAATPVRCSEVQLESHACPYASAVGIVTVLTTGNGPPQPGESPLFNMIAPAGAPAELGFDAAGVGIFAHLKGEVRSDGDYGLSATSNDILSRAPNPVLAAQAQLWGDPSDPSHDGVRGACDEGTGPPLCPVEEQKTALLTLPSECSESLEIGARADSWEDPGEFKVGKGPITDATGNPNGVEGCNQLEFKPAISSRPTTNLTDSPSGLDFTLHQPQDTELEHLSTAALRDATVTLPGGMAVNPSQADGLAACSPEQIGLATKVGESPVRFDKSPNSCPDESKIGTVEVKSPLLAEYDEAGFKLELDPETGNPIPRPLLGSVYIAEPFENPFDSLIAIYLAIEDPNSGTVAKLAGKAIPDPLTGQLTTRFEENPQLPLEDVSLHLFGGARAPLITPLACGTHITTSQLTPWSAPQGKDATPTDSFATSAPPGGGSCPSAESQAPNKPAFTAGMIAPQAGAYSPFVLKLSRNDGSQRLAGIEATLPKGLAARFAGVAQCSEAQIAQAQARSHPNEGAIEKQSPSCPTSSQVGTVDVAAGAGPTPLHTQGNAYLAGPYKGAPLSMVIITPAIAGPFDLGAVTVRTALYVDPDTAQGRAVSDPLPQILDGIPLDVRSIALTMDRPDFTLNPTNCEPMAVIGTATSSLGQSAALSDPFQVGGCSGLPFKPKLSLALKGGTKRASHPKLIASLKAKPGEANIASAQVKLPPSAFLDQAHIRTICTRVQFAVDACPKGSIYGEASATTPLLDQPLTGNVYLRSSNHKLPDLVVALKGPASLPIEIDLAGKTDSVKGALRNTFEAVPDAPVTKFRLELFGGKRGLVVNSRNLCKHPYKAEVSLEGQNGKVFDTKPVVKSDCGERRKKGKKHPHR